MQPSDVVACLERLARLDIDAVRAYGRAIDAVTDERVRAQLAAFRDEHERHVDALAAQLLRLGGEAPRRSPDAAGLLIEGFTATSGAVGTLGALWAMQMNELLTNATYRAAAALDLPPEVAPLVERGVADERRHIDAINQALTGIALDAVIAVPRRVLQTRSTGWAPTLFGAAFGLFDASLDVAAAMLRPGLAPAGERRDAERGRAAGEP
jgi:rubrerythrin